MILLLAAALAVPAEQAAAPKCSYTYTVWNVKAKKSLIRKTVSKAYGELTPSEKGPLGCTPCVEDQQEVVLSNGLKFQACKKAAEPVRKALEAALAKGQKIVSVLGYRAQMSKGAADKDGNRTELSNHAFGTAVDLNEEHNGLYENCISWGPKCRLRKGGKYRPGADPLSLTKESPALAELKAAGFEWGGKIEGRQKDFMHFSPTGY
ncbi:MAG TPA: hypothetical protein DCM05_12370 [Elusimicrobia bacterium]|nr:hypothetical protein [Elusimicrobiota bacterium]